MLEGGSVHLPERLEASQRDEEGRSIPADEFDTAKLIRDSRYCSSDNGLYTSDE